MKKHLRNLLIVLSIVLITSCEQEELDNVPNDLAEDLKSETKMRDGAKGMAFIR